jgi:hypothetical protein
MRSGASPATNGSRKHHAGKAAKAAMEAGKRDYRRVGCPMRLVVAAPTALACKCNADNARAFKTAQPDYNVSWFSDQEAILVTRMRNPSLAFFASIW